MLIGTLAMIQVLGTASAGETIVIDFETDTSGNPLVEWDVVEETYQDWHVTFYIPGGGAANALWIAQAGAPRLAFDAMTGGQQLVDIATSGTNALSDAWRRRQEFGAEFDAPVSEVSFQLIDFGDSRPPGTPMTVGLYAYDNHGALVASDVRNVTAFAPGDPADGAAIKLSVSGSNIRFVETIGMNMEYGKSIDDFIFTLETFDSDGDGVLDDDDDCAATAVGAVVDDTGCSIDQHCPCDGGWQNHGQYVSCVANVTGLFTAAGLVATSGPIVSTAARSSCGR